MFEKAACLTKIFVWNKKRMILRMYAQRGDRKGVVDELPGRYVGRSSACVVICSTRRVVYLYSAHNEGQGLALLPGGGGQRGHQASEDIHSIHHLVITGPRHAINHVSCNQH